MKNKFRKIKPFCILRSAFCTAAKPRKFCILHFALCISLVLSMLAGCSSAPTTSTSEKDTPITLGHVGIEGMMQARAGDTTGYTGNMWVYTKSATKTDAKYNSEKVLWTVTNGTPTIDETATPTLYTGIEGDQTMWAFTSQLTNFELPPYFVSNVFNVMDILYGKTTLYGAEVENLLMRHLFTKVTVNITEFGSELSYTPEFKNNLESDGVWLTGLLSKVKIDHSGVDNPISPADEAEYNGETKMCHIGQNENTGYYQSDALVFPSAEQTIVGICVRVTVNGEEKYLTTTFQPCRKDGEGNIINYGFEAGYHYTVNLKVGKDKIEVEDITVGNWNGGTAEQPDTGWSDETNLDGTEGNIGTPDAGKTAWADGDQLIVTVSGNNMADQSLTVARANGTWTPDKTIKYDKAVTPTLTVTAIYAPCYEVDADGNKVLKEGMQLGMTEYLEATCSESDGKVTISFGDVTRNYSRLRIAGAAENTYTVTTTGFTPVGNGTAPADGYSLTTDEIGNAYLYGTFAKDATVTVKDGETELKKYTFTDATEDAKSYALDAIPTHTYDETTKTYYVYKVEGLYAWNEAAQEDLSANLTLMADITLPTVAEGESNWTPVGTATTNNHYTGTIEGNGYTISGLTINGEIVSAGFVGYALNATIQNLTLTQVNVTASNPVHVGGIVGYARNSTISGCAVTGNLTATGSTATWITIGGIAGWVYNTDVTDCKNEANLTSSAEFTGIFAMGGITGKSNASINGCTNSGSVTGGSTTNENTTAAISGIVGQYEGEKYEISLGGEVHSYYAVMHKNTNSGSVIGGSATNIYTGGLVGMETSVVDDSTTYGSVVFSCNANSGTVKDKDGNELNCLVGGSATGESGSETYQPLTTLTDCDGSCSTTD